MKILKLLFIIVLSFFIFFRFQSALNQDASDENNTGISEKKITQKNSYYNIDAIYPQFDGEFEIINKEIEKTVLEELDKHKIQSEDSYNSESSPEDCWPIFPFDFTVNYHIDYKTTELLSLYLEFYGYSGGAHGYSFTVPFNYNVTSKKFLKITDFVKDQKTLAKLIELCKKKLLEQNINVDEWGQNILASYDDFKIFTLTEDQIIIHFAQYQVCCYAAGEPSVIIPLTELE